MSTTTHFHDMLGLSRDAKPTRRRWKLLAHLRTTWDAVGEGFAAARRYQELTRRGVPHEEAASKVFFEHYADR